MPLVLLVSKNSCAFADVMRPIGYCILWPKRKDSWFPFSDLHQAWPCQKGKWKKRRKEVILAEWDHLAQYVNFNSLSHLDALVDVFLLASKLSILPYWRLILCGNWWREFPFLMSSYKRSCIYSNNGVFPIQTDASNLFLCDKCSWVGYMVGDHCWSILSIIGEVLFICEWLNVVFLRESVFSYVKRSEQPKRQHR